MLVAETVSLSKDVEQGFSFWWTEVNANTHRAENDSCLTCVSRAVGPFLLRQAYKWRAKCAALVKSQSSLTSRRLARSVTLPVPSALTNNNPARTSKQYGISSNIIQMSAKMGGCIGLSHSFLFTVSSSHRFGDSLLFFENLTPFCAIAAV